MSHIKFTLGTDNAPFKEGLKNAENEARAGGRRISESFDEIGKDVSRKLSRSFGAGDVFKSVLASFNIGSVEKVVDFLTEGFKRAAEAAKDVASLSERAVTATLALIDFRRTDAQRLDALNKEQARSYREMRIAQMNLANGWGDEEANQKKVAELNAEIAERAVKIAQAQKKVDDDAKKRAEDLANAKDKLARATLDTQREQMTDAERLDSLEDERAGYALDALNYKKSELERTESLTKEQETERQIVALKKKIQDDAAAVAKKEADEIARAKKEAADLKEKLDQAGQKLAESAKKVAKATEDLNNAKFDPFRFTLAEAASGQRGSGRARNNASLIQQKEQQARDILDRNNLQYNSRGELEYIPAPGESPEAISQKQRIAREQTAPRLNALIGNASALRGATANLDRKEQDPTAEARKALREALDESKNLEAIKKSLEGKFKNQ